MDLSLRHENLLRGAFIGRCFNPNGVISTYVEPEFPSFWHYFGAVLRVPVLGRKKGYSDIFEEARRIWQRYGDRGWSDLVRYACEPSGDVVYFPMQSWLIHNRAAWPGAINQWPEQTIRDAVAMHKVLGLPHTIQDCLYAVWPLLRKDEQEVAAMLGGKPGDSMYSVLSTWGQFPYTLPPSTASNLWREFMTAYRRKRRPLTYNPVSLIGKDPYIIQVRLARGEF